MQGHSGAVEAIGVMRTLKYVDGPDLIATGSADGTIRIWERKVVDDTHGKKEGHAEAKEAKFLSMNGFLFFQMRYPCFKSLNVATNTLPR